MGIEDSIRDVVQQVVGALADLQAKPPQRIDDVNAGVDVPVETHANQDVTLTVAMSNGSTQRVDVANGEHVVLNGVMYQNNGGSMTPLKDSEGQLAFAPTGGPVTTVPAAADASAPDAGAQGFIGGPVTTVPGSHN